TAAVPTGPDGSGSSSYPLVASWKSYGAAPSRLSRRTGTQRYWPAFTVTSTVSGVTTAHGASAGSVTSTTDSLPGRTMTVRRPLTNPSADTVTSYRWNGPLPGPGVALSSQYVYRPASSVTVATSTPSAANRTVAPASGAPPDSQRSSPVTTPVTTPHDCGGVTSIVTSTGPTANGVSSSTVSHARRGPGWSTPAAPASRVTVTSTDPPGSTVTAAGVTDSHGTRSPTEVSQSSNPGSCSTHGTLPTNGLRNPPTL